MNGACKQANKLTRYSCVGLRIRLQPHALCVECAELAAKLWREEKAKLAALKVKP